MTIGLYLYFLKIDFYYCHQTIGPIKKKRHVDTLNIFFYQYVTIIVILSGITIFTCKLPAISKHLAGI